MMTAQNEHAQSPYATIPYLGVADPGAHVRCLEGLAALFGVEPVDITACRVLELGCASGRNLIPQACEYPNSHFVGIDFAADQVAGAQAIVDELGLANIEPRHASFAEVDESWGQFDYILCPGVFSWVTPELQEKILTICKENLSPQGVAVVSYNVYPGWYSKNLVRDLIRYHAAAFDEPGRQISEARSVLELVADSVAAETVQGKVFTSERDYLRTTGDDYLYHDYLVEDNRPLYFHEFVQRAEVHDLQFVSDASLAGMSSTFMSREVQEVLARTPLVQRCQLLDFLRNEAFHKTLLCHRQVALDRQWKPEGMIRFHVALAEKPTPTDFDIGSQEPVGLQFTPGRLTTGDPLGKAAIKHLIDIWPKAARIDELHAAALDELPQTARTASGEGDAGRDTLAGAMLGALDAGLLKIYLHPPELSTTLSDRPRVTPLSAILAREWGILVNQVHENVTLDNVQRFVATRLDGHRDRNALLDELGQSIAAGELKIEGDGQTVPQVLDGALSELCTQALLVG